MSQIIKAVFIGRFCTTRRIFRWDTDDKLQFVNLDLPQNYTVDFANSLTGQSVPVLATSDTVQIPPDMFVPGSEIYAWVWISDTNGGHTKCQTTIPVDPRAQRSGTSPAPAQASAWDQAVQTLNDAAADYETAISHAPIIQNGYWFIWDSTAGEYVTTDVKAEGVDGAGVWYTTDLISGNENPFVRRRSLIGREGATVQVHDLLFAPDVGYDGAPTTLYEITSVGITCALNRLCKMQGAPGEPGEDGYSPEVTITEIEGGHRVTITDEDHPDGQSFDVMDGTGSSITVDSALSDSSENPVQNKIIKAALDNKGTYSKPSGGIPKTDLASTVQTSLGKADTALQSAPVTSVNGQTGAVSLSIPSTAADVGAIAAPANPSSAQDLVYLNGAWVAADKLYIVNCTPTAPDYSGTMDKTVAEIYAAYQEDKTIVFRVWAGQDAYMDVSSSFHGSDGRTYPSFNAYLVYDSDNALIEIYTGTANDGTRATYGTFVYPLSRTPCIPAPATPATGDFLCWNGSAWAATSLSTWQGGNY